MTQRLRENVDELQKFSKTTETINREINKNIVILSNLLQVSHLITQNAQLKEVIEVGVKCLSSGAMTFAALILKDWETSDFLVKYVSGGENVEFAQEDLLKTRIKLGEGLLGKALLKPTLTLLDQNSAKSSEIENFRKIFPLLNAVLTPVTSKGNVFGLLVAGNNTPQFVCSSMDSELLQIIAQQLSIAITNDLLTKEIEKLAVVDKLTGLYNQNFIRTRLAEEIKRAVQFQRPCSFVLITIDRFRSFHEAAGRIAAENILIRVAGVLKEIKDEAIKTARFGDHEFALIFPEKSKRQSLQLSEEIKEKIEQVFQQGERQQNSLLCRVVVTENPLDGNSAEELIAKAEKLLKANS
jgi:diguanylate cyclase (GGDEF)-like protein